MSAALFLAEIAGLSALVCLAHRARTRLGLGPLYALAGLLEAFLFVVGKPAHTIKAEFFLTAPRGIYLLFLAGLLVSVVLVYVLEGTAEARRFIAALVGVYVVHGAIDVLVAYHAAHPPPGAVAQPDIDVVWYSTEARIASLAAMVVDSVVIVVSYQFLRNRAPWLPLMAAVFVALVLAMVNDAAVFKLVRHGALDWGNFHVIAKAQAGAAAGIPAALYFGWHLRRAGGAQRDGLLGRRTLDLVDLRQRVSEMEARLAEEQARYALVRETFSRYVSPDVVDAIMEDPKGLELGGEVRDVTILFADIRSYSTLSEALTPPEIIDLLNIYFERVTDVILRHRGMINEFEGDGVLAVFGAPLLLPDHAARATRAALDLLTEVEALNARWEADGTLEKWRRAGVERLAVRVGVHSGQVVVGNVGSSARTKYAVIGDTVNTAARVEGLNKQTGTSALITAATFEALGDEELARRFEDRGEHAVKGRVEPVRVFAVRE